MYMTRNLNQLSTNRIFAGKVFLTIVWIKLKYSVWYYFHIDFMQARQHVFWCAYHCRRWEMTESMVNCLHTHNEITGLFRAWVSMLSLHLLTKNTQKGSFLLNKRKHQQIAPKILFLLHWVFWSTVIPTIVINVINHGKYARSFDSNDECLF